MDEYREKKENLMLGYISHVAWSISSQTIDRFHFFLSLSLSLSLSVSFSFFLWHRSIVKKKKKKKNTYNE